MDLKSGCAYEVRFGAKPRTRVLWGQVELEAKAFSTKTKNQNKFSKQEVPTRLTIYYHVLRSTTRIYLIIRLHKKSPKNSFQHLQNTISNLTLITTRPTHVPFTKTKKIKLTHEKAFQKYTKSRLKRGLIWRTKDSRPPLSYSIQDQKGTFQYHNPPQVPWFKTPNLC